MHDLVPLKNLSELPPHITIQEFREIVEAVDRYFDSKKLTKTRAFKRDRDKLFLRILWETGGRVADVCRIEEKDFDFERGILNLKVAKTKKILQVPLGQGILLQISEYLRKWDKKDHLFGFTRVEAWHLIKRYSKLAGIDDVHPHKFRHGLAIHLLNSKVPIPIISARLGHSTTRVTQEMYLKITPEIQKQFLDNIELS